MTIDLAARRSSPQMISVSHPRSKDNGGGKDDAMVTSQPRLGTNEVSMPDKLVVDEADDIAAPSK